MPPSVIPDVVLDEARAGDAEQAVLRLRILEEFPRLAASVEAEQLAAAFLKTVLPPRAARDAAHLAIATVGIVKYLLTWNCHHLANAADFKLPGGLHARGIDGNVGRMKDDLIVGEVRRVREKLARRFGHDIHAIFADLRARQRADDPTHPLVRNVREWEETRATVSAGRQD